MKFAAIMLGVLSALYGQAAAEACIDGLDYCGYNLLRVGNYRAEIVQELNNKHITNDEDHVRNSILKCGEGGHGWIIWHNYCRTGCRDGGRGNSDSC